MALRVPVICDTHFGARGDNAVLYETMAAFFENVFWPAIDAEPTPVTRILHLGDVTDRRRQINYQTLHFAKHVFFEPAKERNIQVEWIVGNHDAYYKQSLRLVSARAFSEYDNVVVHNRPTVVSFDGVDTLLIPWVCQENEEETLQYLHDFTGAVIAGHLELSGFDMYRGLTSQHGWSADPFKHYQLVMSGHYHHPSTRGNIHYLGAPYEMVWADYGDVRGFHWWTPQTHTLELIENPYHLFYKFIYDDRGQDSTYAMQLLEQVRRAQIGKRIVKIFIRGKSDVIQFESFMDGVMQLGAHELHTIDETAWDTASPSAAEESTEAYDTLTMIHRHVSALPWSNAAVQQDVTQVLTKLYHQAIERTRAAAR